MANQALVPRPQGFFKEAPLNFLREAEQSVWKSLFANLRETLFPEKLPPLELTSKPVPVPEIWSRKKPGRAAAGSITLHGLVIGAVIGITFLASQSATNLTPTSRASLVTPLMSDYVPNMHSSAVAGGGDHDKLTESKGRLPKITKEQFAKPTVIIRNLQPKLAMEASIVAPPDLNMPNVNLPNIGNPMASRVAGPPSNGTGSGGGIGSGSGGSIGNGMFRMGQAGVTSPVPTYSPDPEFSDEARRNKHEGTVTLQLVVGADGRPRNVRILRPLGMGLDEKALEKVKTWIFEPGKKDGQPVAVLVNIEVAFFLH